VADFLENKKAVPSDDPVKNTGVHAEVLVHVQNLSVHFPVKTNWFGKVTATTGRCK
jgi:hypothetical protein